MNSFLRFYDSPGRRDVLRASVRLFDAKAKCAEVFLLICEEFGIGICVTYSPVQRRGPWVLARPARFVDARAERSERSASKGEAEKPEEGRRREGNGRRRRRRKKVKKTRASWRRLFAWVSLGGRRVCLVESAADL